MASGCVQSVPLPFTTLICKWTSATFIPAGAWRPTQGEKSMRANFEVRALEADIEVVPAVQVADVENAPGNHVALGQYATANGMTYASGWTAVNGALDGKKLWRPGWLVKNTSTTDTNFAVAGGVIQTNIA